MRPDGDPAAAKAALESWGPGRYDARFNQDWQHPPYFHDGSAATMLDLVKHYDGMLGLQLTPAQQVDLEQYVISL